MAKNIDTMRTFLTTANDIVKALGEVNPRDEEFDDLLLRHERLCQNALRYMDVQERISFFLSEMEKVENGDEIDAQPVSKITPIKPRKTKAKTEPVEDFPAPDEDPYPEATPTYTAEEVKEAFTKAARDGVSVAVIINELGYEKLSAVPAEKYPSLMEQLDLAIKEKS